jgi:hypothetical protein
MQIAHSYAPGTEPATELKELLGFVSQTGLCSPAQINVQKLRRILALPLSLQAPQLVHGAIKLTVQVSFVAAAACWLHMRTASWVKAVPERLKSTATDVPEVA